MDNFKKLRYKNSFKLTVLSFLSKNFTNQKIPNENLVDLEKLKGDKFEDLSNQGIMSHRNKKTEHYSFIQIILRKT